MEKRDFINNTLSILGFKALNDMQKASVSEFDNDNDYILLSATGSGKTLAFLLPVCDSLLADKSSNNEGVKESALIIVPARELALQIQMVVISLKSGLTTACCYGGNDIAKEKAALSNFPDIIIGTPGRILDHIRNKNYDFNLVKYLVLDEFDKSLEFGFTDEMQDITNSLLLLKKKILTSATQSIEIPQYIVLNNHKVLNFLQETQNKESLSLYRVDSPIDDKLETLYELICSIGEGQKIVFCNYRESVERISSYLNKKNVEVVAFHGGLEQIIREKSIAKFRNKSVEVLVSTDLAARGIDIDNVNHIIHYHIPSEKETFIHRNGRTARMNKTGNSYLILGPNEYVPDYVENEPLRFKILNPLPKPTRSPWATLYIGKGKKDKISKGDIVGFFIKQGELKGSDLGTIEVKDQHSFVAVNKTLADSVVKKLNGLKMKSVKILIEKAR